MDESPFCAALVGNPDSHEMAPVRPAISRHFAGWEIREFSGLNRLEHEGQAGGYSPDVILVLQHWRDEYSAEEVRQGLGAYPVARWVCVYGAWCESEGRHGSRWPMAVRVPLRSLGTRLAIEARVVKHQSPALPLTAARDEVFEFDTDRRFPSAPREGVMVAIVSPDRELARWLSDLCGRGGYRVILKADDTPADVLIVDLDPFTLATRERLERLKQERPAARIVGLSGWILPEDRNLIESEGLTRLVSKLTPAAEFFEVLSEAVHGKGQGE